MAVLLAVYIVIQLLSLLFLRSGYGLLKGTLETFRTPYDGVILYFAGTIIEAIFGIVIMGAECRCFLHLIDGYDPLLWLIVFLAQC